MNWLLTYIHHAVADGYSNFVTTFSVNKVYFIMGEVLPMYCKYI